MEEHLDNEPKVKPRGLSAVEYRKWYRDVYLKSSHWRRLRRRALAHALYRCAIPTCRSTRRLEVHHQPGGYRLWEEELDDLQVLCRRCHDRATTAKFLADLQRRRAHSPDMELEMDSAEAEAEYAREISEGAEDPLAWWEQQVGEWEDNVH